MNQMVCQAARLALAVAAVAAAPSARGPAVGSVTVTPPAPTVAVGASVALRAILRDHAGNVLTGRTVTWASRNTMVATVSASGVVSGVAVGTDTVTATADRQSGIAIVAGAAPPGDSVAGAPARAFVVLGGRPLQLTPPLRGA